MTALFNQPIANAFVFPNPRVGSIQPQCQHQPQRNKNDVFISTFASKLSMFTTPTDGNINNNNNNNAMDRLSDSCVKAVSFSQDAARNIALQELNNELLMVGMVRSAGAEDKEVRKILTSFGISPDGAFEAATALLVEKGLIQGNEEKQQNNNVSSFSPLPFSSATKKTLDNAISIAQRMSPTTPTTPDGVVVGTVLPGHVLLALLEYDDRYSVATEDNTKCPGLAVLQRTNQNSPVARSFDGTRFCRALDDELRNKAKSMMLSSATTSASSNNSMGGSGTASITEREVVTVGGNAAGGGSTPTLDKVGTDLTEMAREGRLDAVYGRENEIRMCLRTLGRRRKSNPCLIGEPGVGKTAIAEGIAQCLAGGYYVFDDKGDDGGGGGWGLRNPFRNREAENDKAVAGLSKEEVATLPPLPLCPRALQGFRVVSVDLASLVAGMKFRGDFEERILKLIQEASTTPTILFVDELHTLIGAGGGGGDGGMNAANLLKPALARGDIRGR
jgi:ATP-dependent Clp protease ATP-binding subunit ClpA